MAKLPEMTREEEAEFWKTHSSTDYWDDMEDVDLKVHPSIRSPAISAGGVPYATMCFSSDTSIVIRGMGK